MAFSAPGLLLWLGCSRRASTPHHWIETLSQRLPVGAGHLALLMRQLALLKGEGLTLAEALEATGGQCAHPGLRGVMREVHRQVLQGGQLPEALAQYPHVFNSHLVGMIQLGERTGRLYLVFCRLADTLEHEVEARRDFGVAALYPVVVGAFSISVALLLLMFIVPQFAAFYSDFSGGEAQLPALTRKVIQTSDLLLAQWPLALLLPLLPLGWQPLRRSRPMRLFLDPLLLSLPWFCWRVRKAAVAGYFFAAGMALRAGLTPHQALSSARSCVANYWMHRALDRLVLMLDQGRSLEFALRHVLLLPPDARNMLAAGAEAGRLDRVLLVLANDYHRELKRTVAVLTSLLEPALMLLVGCVIFVIVVSLYLPIFNLVDVIK
jgi:type II secretory pathway component PulF